MRNPLSKMVAEMEPSGIRRFFDVASTMDNVISLGVGEPDFDTPWHIREEGIYSLEKGRTFYTSNAGLLPLRKEVCTYLKRRFALSYDSDEVIITVGGSEAIDIAFRTMLDPGYCSGTLFCVLCAMYYNGRGRAGKTCIRRKG